MSTTKSKPKSKDSTSSSSSSTATKRLAHELRAYETDPNPCLVHLGPVNDADLFHWEAVLKGPKGTAYEGGLWLLTLTPPPSYPNAPPTLTFLTPICHPNISQSDGSICLTLLTSTHWLPSYTLSSTLSAVHQLLSDPGLDSPLNVDVANLLREGDGVGGEALVRFWTGEKRWRGEGRAGWISEREPGTGGKLGE